MLSQQTRAGINLLLKLSGYVDSRVSPSGWHSLEVARLAKRIACKLFSDTHDIHSAYWAALFHDVGKAGIPEGILSKPGPLSEEEWRVMKLHPIIGANLVRSIPFTTPIETAIHSHQERYDGSGYPDGLEGDEIPLLARILAVVDAFDAMTSDRFYRKALKRQAAMREMRKGRGNHFDPKVIDAFFEAIKDQKILRPSGTKDRSAVPPCLPRHYN